MILSFDECQGYAINRGHPEVNWYLNPFFSFIGQDHTIEREVILGSNGIKLKRQITVEELRNEYRLDDIMQFSKSGVEVKSLFFFIISTNV